MQCRALVLSSQRASAPSLAQRPRCRDRAHMQVVAYLPDQKQGAVKNQLDALKSMSVVVADTGEMALVKKYQPQDCTTNPR